MKYVFFSLTCNVRMNKLKYLKIFCPDIVFLSIPKIRVHNLNVPFVELALRDDELH